MFLCSIFQVVSIPELLPSPQKTCVLSMSRFVSSGTDLYFGDSWKARVLVTLDYCYQLTSSTLQHRSMNFRSLKSVYSAKKLMFTDLVRCPHFPSMQHHLLSASGIMMSFGCGIPLMTRRTEPEVREVLGLCIHRLFLIIVMTDFCQASNSSSDEIFVSTPICLAAGVLCSGEPSLSSTFIPSHDTGSPTILFFSGMILRSATTNASKSLSNWAWPILGGATSSPESKSPRPKVLKHQMQHFVKVVVLANLKIFGGFIGVSNSSIMLHFSSRKKLLVDSPGLILFPYLLSMNGDVSLGHFPSACFNLFTGLLPCVAVCTGPEGAIETTSVSLVGEGWLSTSLVTNYQSSDHVVEALPTHLSLVLNLLSTSYEDLSCLISFATVAYFLSSRECLIPSCLCNF